MSTTTATEFANMIGGSQKGSLREEVRDMEVRIDDHLASAWVEYDFFFNGKFHHCGVDAFQLHKQGRNWKITQISDTRRDDCSQDGEAMVINKVMDAWHASASNANIQSYFDQLSDDAVFLGTDPTENWSKNEFHRFAKPFFDKGQVWDFKASERNVSFSEQGDISWFNELLDTWMGKCRGSGVLRKTSDGRWELTQYNLAILVPNDKVSDYLKLIEKR
jgi:ketosteroid isomerase-like protein